jgi:hypothetical protein
MGGGNAGSTHSTGTGAEHEQVKVKRVLGCSIMCIHHITLACTKWMRHSIAQSG